jgi:hypothetical protein
MSASTFRLSVTHQSALGHELAFDFGRLAPNLAVQPMIAPPLKRMLSRGPARLLWTEARHLRPPAASGLTAP